MKASSVMLLTMADSSLEPALDRIPVDDCSMVKALDLLGDRWTMLILREAFYGVRRFEEILADLSIPRTVLSMRLSSLVDAGALEKSPYRDVGQRGRFEYRLTQKGRDLLPVFIALMEWGDKHVSAKRSPPLVLRHRATGKRVRVALVSEDGHVIKNAGELSADIKRR